jgi:hypothetical protein
LSRLADLSRSRRDATRGREERCRSGAVAVGGRQRARRRSGVAQATRTEAVAHNPRAEGNREGLEGARGEAPVDVGALADTMCRFAQLGTDGADVAELGVNLVGAQVAVDRRLAGRRAGLVGRRHRRAVQEGIELPVRVVETMSTPGAPRCTVVGPTLENPATVVAATPIMLGVA